MNGNRNTVSCSAFLSRLGRLCALAVAGLFAATATADPYLTFSSAQSFTIKPPGRTWAGTVECSTDATSWSVFTGAAAADDGSGTYKLYLRGKGNNRISSASADAAAWTLTASANVACEGNIETLLDHEAVGNGQHPAMDAYCFINLFKGWTALTHPPALPATTLNASHCYRAMFQGCTGLTNAPALPATALTAYCYQYMFLNCTGLTRAPALPATTLATGCYYAMFRGCTGIKLHRYGPAGAEWSIPADATGSPSWNAYMFEGTSGTFTGDPVIGTVYYQEPADFPAYNQHYLTFSSAQSFTIRPPSKMWAGTIEYSTDATNWTAFITAGAAAADDGTGTYKLHLRGAGNTRISTTVNVSAWGLTASANVACSGNAETLLDYTAAAVGQHPAMDAYCFANLFKGWTKLTNAPALPATTLANYCYYSMFQGCTGLTQAPALPATTLADYCYYSMFQGCTGLTQAPALPATTLANYCYYSMFNGCTGIRLHTQGPAGAEWSIPAGATTPSYWNSGMLAGTGGTFTGNPVRGTVYYQETADFPYEHLTFSSAQPFTITPPSKTWAGTVEYSTDATSWSAFTTAGATAADDGSGTYRLYLRGKNNTRFSTVAGSPGWTLTAAGAIACEGNIETLLDYTMATGGQHPAMADYCFANLFTGWTALTNAPALPATTLTRGCYLSMFQGCTGLAQAPALPATTLADYCYNAMFLGCTGLTNAPTLPATTLAESCYNLMFHNCTGLTQPPALPATTLARACYSQMFRLCTGLTQPPALPATTLATSCYYAMFRNCTGIKLSTQGPGAEWGIPAGATAQTSWNDIMLDGTGGSFTGDPEIGVIYYCTSAPGPDPDPDPEAPVITAITVDTGASTLEITIDNAITGAWYTLLVADELGDPWAVSPAVQATADGILVFQNVPATLPHRFYKVRASATQP